MIGSRRPTAVRPARAGCHLFAAVSCDPPMFKPVSVYAIVTLSPTMLPRTWTARLLVKQGIRIGRGSDELAYAQLHPSHTSNR
jgi:hypothetical protein